MPEALQWHPSARDGFTPSNRPVVTRPAPTFPRPSASAAALSRQILGVTATEPYDALHETFTEPLRRIGLSVEDAIAIADAIAVHRRGAEPLRIDVLAADTGCAPADVHALIANLVDADDIRAIDHRKEGTRAVMTETALVDPSGDVSRRPHNALLYYLDTVLRDQQAYQAHRARWLEDEIERIVTRSQTPAHTDQRVLWEVSNETVGELDALTTFEDFAVRWQAKSTLHPIRVLDGIRHALKQHARLRADMTKPTFQVANAPSSVLFALRNLKNIDAVVTIEAPYSAARTQTDAAHRLLATRAELNSHIIVTIGELHDAVESVGKNLPLLLANAYAEADRLGTHRPLAEIAATRPELHVMCTPPARRYDGSPVHAH